MRNDPLPAYDRSRTPEPFAVEKVIFGGNGMVRKGGKIGFVPFVLGGEQIEATTVSAKKDFFNAQLERLTVASPHRVEPQCPYFGRCGGCAYQHATYEHQLVMKRNQVEEALRRVGGFTELEVRPTVGSPKQYGYRNRITVHRRGGRIGFMARNRHHLVDVSECPIAEDAVNDQLTRLRRAPYEEGDVTLRSPETPTSFSQVNNSAVPLLLQTISDLLDPTLLNLVDTYSGTGLYSRALQARYRRITGVEWSTTGVRLAREMSQRDKLEHLAFIAGDVAEQLPSVLTEHDCAETAMIVNPPAVGVDPKVCDTILEHCPMEIVYVSCSPPTLSRDLKRLAARYELRSVTPVDLFPQTAEVEVVVHLRLKSATS